MSRDEQVAAKITQTDADGRVVWEGYPPDESPSDKASPLVAALTYYAEGRYPDGGEIAREALADHRSAQSDLKRDLLLLADETYDEGIAARLREVASRV